jgi:hypothetical protein
MPRVTIQYNSSLDQAYQQILDSIDARYHNYQTTFQRVHATEEQYGEMETNTAYANHAGELYRNGTHIERLLG